MSNYSNDIESLGDGGGAAYLYLKLEQIIHAFLGILLIDNIVCMISLI